MFYKYGCVQAAERQAELASNAHRTNILANETISVRRRDAAMVFGFVESNMSNTTNRYGIAYEAYYGF